MQAPRRGDGADFDPEAEYRMYHGDRVPGYVYHYDWNKIQIILIFYYRFPQHPHRGFETITATITGYHILIACKIFAFLIIIML